MAFSQLVVNTAWKMSAGTCQCRKDLHEHANGRCGKQLVFENRGREGRGAWEAHHIITAAGDILSNCDILCWECHRDTKSFGR